MDPKSPWVNCWGGGCDDTPEGKVPKGWIKYWKDVDKDKDAIPFVVQKGKLGPRCYM